MLTEKLDQKEMKVGTHEKPFISAELKKLSRQKMREYNKRGKTQKYLNLAKQFGTKYNAAAEAYLRKNMDNLKHTVY